ncbi:MAG: hypothetical protein F6K11_23720 [Leptolyngbya sp. SIO3F4]|nr:hypothetical protein [Leptolyngbya sp. SIO3F4]
MMGLFSSPVAGIQFFIAFLSSLGLLTVSAIAQEESFISDSSDKLVGAPIQDDFLYQVHSMLDAKMYLLGPNRDLSMTNVSALQLGNALDADDEFQEKTLRPNLWELADAHNGDYGVFLDSKKAAKLLADTQQLDDDSDDDDSNGDESGDDELGILRVRSQPVGLDGELGLLRVRQNNPNNEVPLEVEPEPTRQTSVFLTGRTNVYGGNNLFRTPRPIEDRIYQVGIGVFAFPRISDSTNLLLSAEANLARYEDLSVVDYNELQFQAGIRQRLGKRSYGQLNWRFQELSTPGSESFFTANYLELLLSRRDILNNRVWLDTYYQARLSHSDPKAFSRFSHIATGSLNYGFDPETRISLLYQLFLDDYTEVVRFDTYHQILAQVSHDISSTTRLSLFTGFRFGDSSLSVINFDDTIYGASVNVNVPLF